MCVWGLCMHFTYAVQDASRKGSLNLNIVCATGLLFPCHHFIHGYTPHIHTEPTAWQMCYIGQDFGSNPEIHQHSHHRRRTFPGRDQAVECWLDVVILFESWNHTQTHHRFPGKQCITLAKQVLTICEGAVGNTNKQGMCHVWFQFDVSLLVTGGHFTCPRLVDIISLYVTWDMCVCNDVSILFKPICGAQ